MTDLKIFCNELDESARLQIERVAQQDAYTACRIRIMPDAHAGIGCTIGTTMTLTDKVTPNLVGVDIGCGMLVAELGKVYVDPLQLEHIIAKDIPSGRNIRTAAIPETDEGLSLVKSLRFTCGKQGYHALSVGTLGGGNHFVELNIDDDDRLYLVIHSGSRNLGKMVCEHYQRIATHQRHRAGDSMAAQLIARLKAEGRTREIQQQLKEMTSQVDHRDDLAWLVGDEFDNYIHDMEVCRQFASLNRSAMMRILTEALHLKPTVVWQTVHNYIDTENMILRKGAISARKGERVIIPMNMRDGSLICIGKGNPDWNYSAPHGAGRLLSRFNAFKQISMEEFRNDMHGIASWSICESTIDEAPAAYKPMASIISQIAPTATVERIISPIYNYKAH